MPANAAITVPDSQATPVDHVFTPMKVAGDVASYANFAEDVSLARESLSLTLKDGSKVRKVTATLRVPRVITETLNGVDVVSSPDYAMSKVEFFVPETWDEASTEDLIEMTSQLLQQAVVISMVDRGEFVY